MVLIFPAVVISNLILYTKTIYSIRCVARKLHRQASNQKNRGRRDFFIYVRMFSALG